MRDKTQECCICGVAYTGHGNKPAPVMEEGKCCDECHFLKVIPTRLKNIGSYIKWEPES